jgi:hypothetical protein
MLCLGSRNAADEKEQQACTKVMNPIHGMIKHSAFVRKNTAKQGFQP